MGTVRKSLEAIKARKPEMDRAKIAATTERATPRDANPGRSE